MWLKLKTPSFHLYFSIDTMIKENHIVQTRELPTPAISFISVISLALCSCIFVRDFTSITVTFRRFSSWKTPKDFFLHMYAQYPTNCLLNSRHWKNLSEKCFINMHQSSIQIIQPTRCNSFTSLLLHVHVSLNMFQASPRPSSGAYNCTRSLWFNRWGSAANKTFYTQNYSKNYHLY